MSTAYSVTVRGVDLRVELNADDTIDSIQAGGEEIRPLLSELVVDEVRSAVVEKFRSEQREAA
jgi:hypothetical protein